MKKKKKNNLSSPVEFTLPTSRMATSAYYNAQLAERENLIIYLRTAGSSVSLGLYLTFDQTKWSSRFWLQY